MPVGLQVQRVVFQGEERIEENVFLEEWEKG
jgi:hypothetical protein